VVCVTTLLDTRRMVVRWYYKDGAVSGELQVRANGDAVVVLAARRWCCRIVVAGGEIGGGGCHGDGRRGEN